MYVVAFFVAFRFAALPHMLRKGLTKSFSDYVLMWTIIAGLLGARLFFVFQQTDLGFYFSNPIRIIAVWQGGMAFFGAIIFGVGTLAIVAWRKKQSFWLLA